LKAFLISITFGIAACCCAACFGDGDDDAGSGGTAAEPLVSQPYVPAQMSMPMPAPSWQPSMDYTPINAAAASPIQVGQSS
jgi:hypothetical protein